MAETAVSLMNQILTKTTQKQVTAFSDDDDSNFILESMNDALVNLYDLMPTQVDVNSSVNLPVSTRLVSLESGLDIYRIYDWSFRINDADGDRPLKVVTREYITKTYPAFETDTANEPRFVYYEGEQLAFYPLIKSDGDAATIQFSYPVIANRLTETTDTFVFPDNSNELQYIKFYAQLEYELDKGLGNPAVTNDKMEDKWGLLVAKYKRGKKSGFKGYRRYG